jgi:hypothetical protein
MRVSEHSSCHSSTKIPPLHDAEGSMVLTFRDKIALGLVNKFVTFCAKQKLKTEFYLVKVRHATGPYAVRHSNSLILYFSEIPFNII